MTQPLDLNLDRKTKTPLSEQIRGGVTMAIESGVLSVTIIPHTWRNTTLAGYRAGSRVNLECDVLAKHVEKLLQKLDLKPGLTVQKLREEGF